MPKRERQLSNVIKELFNSEGKIKDTEKRELFRDILLFIAGFLFSRCHLLFGAHPLGIAFVATLPFGVWQALSGAAIGALSMGFEGVIFAAAGAITAFLRAAVSSKKGENGKLLLFGESLLMRMSISILSGFAAAVYQVLLDGFDETSLLFGLCMVILPPILTFLFSGLFSTGISFNELIFGSKDILSLTSNEEREKYEIIFFAASSLFTIFFIGLSFKGVSLLGISATYIFSSAITLLASKRLGALAGMAVGFASSLGASGTVSVAFALMGLCSGGLFPIGAGYAIAIGGIALSAFSAYASGLTGLVSTLPEYIIASVALLPFIKSFGNLEKEKVEEAKPREESSEDMVGTMALAFQSQYSGAVDSIGSTLEALSGVIKKHSDAPGELSIGEYRDIVISVAEKRCIGCPAGGFCAAEDIRPCIKNADAIALLLSRGEKIDPTDVNGDTEFCRLAAEVAEEINCEAARAERERFISDGKCTSVEEYTLISRLIDEVRARDAEETKVDQSLTAPLTEAFKKCGFEKGTIRVFGKRRKHFIMAGEDTDGRRITSFELRKSIEAAAGVKLCAPEYYSRGSMALMECGIRRSFSVSVATASLPRSEKEISGDTVSTFESSDDYFYSLISDGMGSGEIAKATSEFVSDFIKSAMEIGTAKETLIHMLNRAVKSRREECSATVDLFELDLLCGEGTFIKSGAAPSFIKRDSSIFRIKSKTAPIGLMSSIDTEKIRTEIKPGDHIIMLSDGIVDDSDYATWLLLLLGEPPKKDLNEYAHRILWEAKKNRADADDMSVVVIRVNAI